MQCPYPGLTPFKEEQEKWFYGRDHMVATICERLDSRLTAGGPLVVIGPSGAGKSSLLAAGVLPALARGALPREGARSWPRVMLTPTASPALALAAAAGVEDEEAQRTAAAWRSDPRQCLAHLRRMADSAASAEGRRSPGLVLVVDQFEEIFTQCADDVERQWFIELLDHLAQRAAAGEPTVLVVLGLRADFYPTCLDHPRLRTALKLGPVLLDPMTESELKQAIRLPALDVGLQVEDGLVELLLAELGALGDAPGPGGWAGATQAGRLPLLAHALRATWRERSGHVLTVDGYRTTGGIRKAIANTADQLFNSLPPDGHEVARSVFLRLIVVGRDADDARRQVPYRTLLRESPNPQLATTVVDVFTDGRLLTRDQDTVAITHEALMRAWPLLRGWIDQDRAGNLLRQDLAEAAAAWDQAERDPAALYRGNRLEAALAWAGGHQHEISAIVEAFLDAARRQEQRGRQQRRMVIAGLTALALIASITAVFAFQQDARARASAAQALRDRDRAINAQVAAEALQLTPTDPSLAAQLSLVAYRMAPTPDAASRLLSTENTPLATRLPGPPGSVYTVAYSPDGHTLAAGNVHQNTVQLWNVTDPSHPVRLGQPLPEDAAVDSILSVAFSPDGHTLAVAGHVGDHTRDWAGNGIVDLWNVTTPGHPVSRGRPVSTKFSSVESVAFSPKGHTLAAGTADGTVSLWNVTHPDATTPLGQPLTVPSKSTDSVNSIDSVAFSPDGHTLAAGTSQGTVSLWNVTHPDATTSLGQPLTGPSKSTDSVN
ncbi:AAA family ATPase, partial [Streptomyces sp. NPDC001793]|uniref:NACHT and WD repeat domain-containing protein n=1 Tax=Streptomyces sp. NPDC001793 TaxID=3154657 RepID=UPI00331E0915